MTNMNGSDPQVDEVIAAAGALEEHYAALIELLRFERKLLVRPATGELEVSTLRHAAVLECIDAGEVRLREAARDFTRRGGGHRQVPGADPTLLEIAARLPDLIDRTRMSEALNRLRNRVRAARALSEAQGRFVDRGLATLRQSLERMAREDADEAGYRSTAGPSSASSGAVIQETA
jgi:hypothetical protein